MGFKEQKALFVSLSAVVLFVAFICIGNSSAYSDDKIILKAGHGVQSGHPTHKALLKFAELIKERTNDRVEVQVYLDRQLGEERDMVEGLQLGSVDLCVVSTGPLAGFVPEISVVDLPFLFTSSEHVYKVFDGEIGQELLAKFKPVGIDGLAFWENGWRHLSTTNKKVMVPSDLEGMKIRTMENMIHMAAFEAMGASPIPMVWGEVYTSLQQGVIDGQENPAVVMATNALWEVQKYYALTGHVYGPHLFLMSDRTMKKLPKDIVEIIKKTVKDVTDYQRELSQEQESQYIEKLKKEGMDVYEVDRSKFKEATKPVYAQFEQMFGKDLINNIINESDDKTK